MTTVSLFEARRFAVHDGPGVRTVLFFKGCPLRCRWCHNPEGMDTRPQVAYHSHKCLHCGQCAAACPQGAHVLAGGRHVFDRRACVACGACEEACLGRALKLLGRPSTVEQARALILADRDFYRDGGGATLSGGEPLLHATFCAELLRRLKADGIHCAVDTCGAVGWECFEEVLPWTDLVLYDLKGVDEERHRRQTGRSNRLILENLDRLTGRKVPVEIRVPVVPGFNDDPGSIDAIGAVLRGRANVTAVRLLPYHRARSKYDAIGLADTTPDVPTPPDAVVAALAGRLADGFGLPVR
ncbi:MAG: glycyl-radical enzyme activating protein [Planctomycetes bacterium]|nr:glycyl-radical enzyme activating protein [Planctomycetota bacterium]